MLGSLVAETELVFPKIAYFTSVVRTYSFPCTLNLAF